MPERSVRISQAMFVRLLLLLTVVPFVELAILLWLAEVIRWRNTLLLIVATGVLGAWLARREGLKTAARIQQELGRGMMPAREMVEGALILAAGLVLVTPGVLTDALGFCLLVPPFRRWVACRLMEAFKKHITVMTPDQRETFIDVEPVPPKETEDIDDERG